MNTNQKTSDTCTTLFEIRIIKMANMQLGLLIEFRCHQECNIVYTCFAKNLQSIQLALQSEKEFVIGHPQTQEQPRINLCENTQTEVSFHMVCMLVTGFSLCLFNGLRRPDFMFAGYFEETRQRWIL